MPKFGLPSLLNSEEEMSVVYATWSVTVPGVTETQKKQDQGLPRRKVLGPHRKSRGGGHAVFPEGDETPSRAGPTSEQSIGVSSAWAPCSFCKAWELMRSASHF